MANNESSRLPFHPVQQTDNQNQPGNNLRVLRINHVSEIPARGSTFFEVRSFPRRTVEGARQLRDNINNVIREIQPLVETAGVQNAINITNFLNNRPQPEPANVARQATNDETNFVINVDDVPTVAAANVTENIAPNNLHTQAANLLNNPPNNTNNNIPDDLNTNEREQAVIEAQQFLQVILKYVPFIIILLAKAMYDFHDGILIIGILLTTFAHTNSAVKKEATKRHRRSLSTLTVELVYIVACLAFIHFAFKDEMQSVNIMMHLIFISTFKHPLTVGYLLWILTVTDFVLKLITVTVKILLTMLPGTVIQFQKRGKVYLFIEAISQLYRSTATIQPWLYYLLESYHGAEKIVAVFLSAFYMISKGSDLMMKVKLFKTAFLKLLQNVSVGSSPSKEEIQTAGEHCPICHDEYERPVLLHCRHIFCESCVTTWFDREQTCPLCRAKIVDDPSWRDGATTYFLQVF